MLLEHDRRTFEAAISVHFMIAVPLNASFEPEEISGLQV